MNLSIVKKHWEGQIASPGPLGSLPKQHVHWAGNLSRTSKTISISWILKTVLATSFSMEAVLVVSLKEYPGVPLPSWSLTYQATR